MPSVEKPPAHPLTAGRPGGGGRYRVAVIPGDGIGHEVVPPTVELLDGMAADFGFSWEWEHLDWGCERYKRVGSMMPETGLEQLRGTDAIFLGAVGAPGVPDHISLWGLLIPIRRAFSQYINLRPVRVLPGLNSSLRDPAANQMDVVVVRENVEGEYSQIGGYLESGGTRVAAMQEAVFTREGCLKVLRYAFETAKRRRGLVTAATKSNGIIYTMPFWDELAREVAADYPSVRLELVHVDALAARLILRPTSLDVVVGSNLFADILSDVSAAAAGSLGIAPSANLNPEGSYPSMFEPVHGSAPDIAGRGIANPVGQLWTAVLMLEHLGEAVAAEALMAAISAAQAAPQNRTPDLGGTASTLEVVGAVERSLRRGDGARQGNS
ncbi:MAG: tartrate dehydrogenase [Actinomycetota bacterium]|nr:tartrate dehydrogenase [Actinomycetota bacterium]